MATYTNLNDEIFARSAIEGLVKTLLPVTRFARNYSPTAAQKGDQVLVPLISTLTATTFNGSYAVCDGTKTVATINLNKHKHVAVGQSDITAHSSSVADLEDFGFQMGAALGTLVITDILSLVTTANFTSATSSAAASLDVANLRAQRLALNVANVPLSPRVNLIDCVGYDGLLGVTNFVQAYMFKDQGVLQEGAVMRALGMDLYEINALFPSGASINSFAAHPDAIAVAMRYLMPQPGNTYLRAEAITDPRTGLTIGLRDHYDNNTGTRYVNLECLYGYAVGLSNCGRIAKRTD